MVSVTDSFINLDLKTRNCQEDEPYKDCTTRKLTKLIFKKCGCLPFALINHYKNITTVTCGAKKIETCVNPLKKVNLECHHNCQGVYVSSYEKNNVRPSIFNNFKSTMKSYEQYKGVLDYPDNLKGK